MRPLKTLALASLLATPAWAFDPAAMSESEKAAFGEAVRAYLMENPQVLVEAINVLETRNQEASAENDKVLVQTHKDAIFNAKADWVGGNPEGDVTVVEFLDYRCGYCRKAVEEVAELVEKDGNIRFIVKEFPILGEESELAARFAVAVKQLAGDEAYKTIHDALMSLRGGVTLESLGALAEKQGHDKAAIIAQMNSEEVSAVLRENRQLAEQLAISGTPAFVIGGQMMKGYAPLATMQEIVKAERG